MVVGAVGSFLANITPPLLEWARVDDAVGILSCHVLCLLSCHVLCQGCQVTGNVMNNMSGGGHLRARGGGRLGDAGGGTVCPD